MANIRQTEKFARALISRQGYATLPCPFRRGIARTGRVLFTRSAALIGAGDNIMVNIWELSDSMLAEFEPPVLDEESNDLDPQRNYPRNHWAYFLKDNGYVPIEIIGMPPGEVEFHILNGLDIPNRFTLQRTWIRPEIFYTAQYRVGSCGMHLREQKFPPRAE